MNYLLLVAILAFGFSVFSYFLELYIIGLENKVRQEMKRIELNKKMKQYQNDPEKMQELFSEMMKLNSQMMFDINRIKIMIISSFVFLFILFGILPKFPNKVLITIPILNIGLNPFWSFFALYFIFILLQNIIITKLLVKRYGKTSIEMEKEGIL